AGSTVTIHEHLDGSVSVRYGPHVVGRFNSDGSTRKTANTKRGGKGGSLEAGENPKQVSSVSHSPLEISQTTRDSHFPTAPTTIRGGKRKPRRREPPKPETGQITY